MRSTIKKFYQRTIWSNLNQILVSSAGVVISVLFARLAAKELYGDYVLIISLVGFISLLSMPGTRSMLFKAVSLGKEKTYMKATRFNLTWSLAVIPALISAGLYFCFTGKLMVGFSLMIISLLYPLYQPLQNWMTLLKGRSKFQKLFRYNLYKIIILLIAMFIAVNSGKILIASVTYVLVISLFNLGFHLKLSKVLSGGIMRGWKRQSYALSLVEFTSTTFGTLDMIIIGIFLGSAQIAIYALTMRLISLFQMVIKSAIEVFLPGIYRNKFRIKYMYLVFAGSFIIPILLFPLIKYLILFLYSSKYSAVIEYSKIYLFVIPFFLLSSISKNLLIKYNLNAFLNLSEVAVITLTVLSYILLIPSLGIMGGIIGSYAYFIGASFFNLGYIHYSVRRNKIAL